MMTYDEVKELIARESVGNECLKECRDALASGELQELSSVPGRGTARDVLANLRVRSDTTSAAGVSTCGFDLTMKALAVRAEKDTLLGFAFSSTTRTFVIYVAESSRSIVGCIRVTKSGPNRQDAF